MKHKPYLPYALLVPGIAVLLAILYPFLTGAWWSFTSYRLNRGAPQFNGGQNFVELFTTGEGLHAIGVTLLYAITVVVIECVVGIGLAILLNQGRYGNTFRLLIVLPLLLPPVIAALMWKVMLTENGVVDWLLHQHLLWLNGPDSALGSVILIDVWIFTPFVVLLAQAGLKSVPTELREASAVDGAGPIRNFFEITLPMLKPVLVVIIAFRGIDSLKMFDIIYTTTKGGPVDATTNLHVLGYLEGIRNLNFGASMAALIVLWALCYAMSQLLLKARREEATA
ncbi:sn-glycerol-3-phosphate transport system permease protein UgpA [Microbacterium azadirachtae]|uniref:sn-glycerol-3-phosphate transport system permease protein UgpA n=1 Tax=Microbacterium azadirachtae TaxID=582680 RepID=A0A0F0KI46_9MICO|nr:sugar ABC transporter permease [Microbacterium azadirachtae]KJL18926.1 sn-glycerol-3-phosphate transport system permease protein UgpA [Microbacterium azadirachtae]